ncbi:hypothetical protein ACUTQ5_19250 [Serratia sp. NA_112.1]|uniref:hypothetical protein n=1 Tax=unclassified Serratia (in: enterobacteria) TaxID=2647522 RepID=UPI004046E615
MQAPLQWIRKDGMNLFIKDPVALSPPNARLVEAILQLWAPQAGRTPGAPETWPSTRDIAESCNFSIYKTRYLLLKMVSKGWIQVTPHPVKNALRWSICPEKVGRDGGG